MPKSVAKKVNYHWNTLRKSGRQPSQKSLEAPQQQLSTSTSAVSKQQRRNSDEEDSIISEKIRSKVRSSLHSLQGSAKSVFASHSTESVNSEMMQQQRMAYSRRCSRVSIMEQVEAYNKPKDSIKKMVFSRWTRRASLMANWFTKSSTDEQKEAFLQPPKSMSAHNGFCRTDTLETTDDEDEEEEEADDEGIGLNASSVSFDSLPYIDDGEVEEISPCSFNSNFKALKTIAPDSATSSMTPSTSATIKRKQFRQEEQRSREDNIQSWQKVARKLLVAKKMIVNQEQKRNMKKMWKHQYVGMCNRAIVLDKVVSEASKQGMKVLPFVTTASASLSSTDSVNKKRKYMGLGRKFYGFRSVHEEDSNTAFKTFSSLAEAQVEDHCGPGDLITLRSTTSHFRLNLRTRSVDTLLENPARRIRIFEHKKRSSLRCTVDCYDEKVHESIVVAASKTSNSSRLARMDRNSLESCETEVSRLVYSLANEPVVAPSSSPRAESPDHRPVERAVEARQGSEDGLGSMVRCLHFAETYIASRKFFKDF